MVLTHTTNHAYAHPFPTVTLAFFLRYCSPKLNPFAQHVLSTDTISSHVDPDTGRLHTTRIHLKKSRIPGAVLKLLPTSVTGGVADKASYILETSVVDIREGWMRTESRNVNFTGILSVVERQLYTAQAPSSSAAEAQQLPLSPPVGGAGPDDDAYTPATGVETTVVFRSRLGERLRERFEQGQQRYQKQFQQFKLQRQQQQQLQQQQLEQQQEQQQEHQQQQQPAAEEPRVPWFGSGWVSGLGTKGVQRTIEAIASTKTMEQLGRSREGMHIILERLRQTGIIGVLELRRRAMEGSLDAMEAV